MNRTEQNFEEKRKKKREKNLFVWHIKPNILKRGDIYIFNGRHREVSTGHYLVGPPPPTHIILALSRSLSSRILSHFLYLFFYSFFTLKTLSSSTCLAATMPLGIHNPLPASLNSTFVAYAWFIYPSPLPQWPMTTNSRNRRVQKGGQNSRFFRRPSTSLWP